jgi:hypothetical protein
MAHEHFTVVVDGKTLTATTTSQTTTIPLNSSGQVPRYIRVVATSQAYVKIGPASVVANGDDFLVQPADSVTLHIPSGVTHIAVYGSGQVNINPLEDL